MDLTSLRTLLGMIAVHYPSFKKHISNDDGGLNSYIINEWHRLIGYMDFDDAVRRFDQYLKLPDGNKYAPDIKWFLSDKGQEKNETFHAPIKHRWHLEFRRSDTEKRNGRLFDEEGREYIVDPLDESGFYYNERGDICQSGKVVFRWVG